jgi:hypothetical protein
VLNFLRPAGPAIILLAALAAVPAGAQTPSPLVTPAPAMSPGPTSPGPIMTPMPMATAMPMMSPSPSPIPTPSNPPENSVVTAQVQAAFNAWQRGHIDRKLYAPYAGGTYMDAYVQIITPDLTPIGPAQTVTYQTASPLVDDMVYRYEIAGSSGAVSVLYSVDANGKIDNIVFTPEIFRTPPTSTK